jgi:predicted HicB family RNase H-like nuclease
LGKVNNDEASMSEKEIKLRVDEQVHKDLKSEAARLGMPLGTYARAMVIKGHYGEADGGKS